MSPISVAVFEAVAGPTMDRVGLERSFKSLPSRIALKPIVFGYNLAIKTRALRKRLGLQVPYGLMKKLGVAGEGIYKEKDSSNP